MLSYKKKLRRCIRKTLGPLVVRFLVVEYTVYRVCIDKEGIISHLYYY